MREDEVVRQIQRVFRPWNEMISFDSMPDQQFIAIEAPLLLQIA
jgi:hypothetical protein